MILEDNLKQVSSKDLKQMYEKNSDMKKFLEKEYIKVRD